MGCANPVRLKVRLRLEPLQRRDEVAAELFGKIDGKRGHGLGPDGRGIPLVIQCTIAPCQTLGWEIESTIAVAPEA